MEVLNYLLDYNNLKIYQNTDWFSFSIDSVLLANFVRLNNKMKILDMCTGNAPIPLFLSTKTKSKITGVEIQKEIYDLAVKSVKINNLDNQINILNKDIKKISNIFETDIFDLITCNPPYFRLEEKSLTNENEIKRKARHEVELCLDDIFKCAKKLLKNNGKIALVHRTNRLVEIISSMKQNNIEPKRLQFIFPFASSNSNLVLIEGSKNGNPGVIVENDIIVHNDDGSYTENINKIFNGGK